MSTTPSCCPCPFDEIDYDVRVRRSRLILPALIACLASGCDEKRVPTPEPLPSASTSVAAEVPKGPKVYEHVVLSEIYEVDEIYKSMQGPSSVKQVALGAKDELELLWIVGFEAVMVSPKGDEKISQEFMCHTNLDLDIEKHQARFGDDKRLTGRLFTLSQGQYRIDFPEGFGMPLISDELLDVNTQVLNLNLPEGSREVRHRVTMRFVRDKELDKPMKALYASGAFGLKLLEGADGHYGRDPKAKADAQHEHGKHEHGKHDHEPQGEEHTACLPGANAGKNSFDDGQGRVFTGHWVVEPGREVNHTPVNDLMALPFDSKVHYVAVHLHPFAESLELRDLTTGKSVYKAKTRQADKGIGLAHVDFYSSQEGFELFKDHDYEVVSVYNNTSGEPQDSMAVLNLYLHDLEFKKPDLSKPAPAPAAPTQSSAPAASAKPAGKVM
jgi:hypothetical protein